MNANIEIVAAVSLNNVIGNGGRLPWHIRTDMIHFRQLTIGDEEDSQIVVFGRPTYESLPRRPLPKRSNLVMTRDKNASFPGAYTVHSLSGVLDLGNILHKKIVVAGGQQVYEQFMPIASVLHITHVLAEVTGDAYFPPIDTSEWQLVESTEYSDINGDDFPIKIAKYVRK